MYRHYIIAVALAATLLAACSSNNQPTVAIVGGAPQEQPRPAQTAAPAPTPLANLAVQIQPVTRGLNQPIHVTHAGDGSERVFVVEKPGRVVIVRNGQLARQPFLDITNRVGSQGSEQGLLSVAFHPRFAQNGQVFVNYTNKQGDTVVSRFQARGDAADPRSETVLLTIDQPFPNHNGGLIKFGPDGFLYIGMGDGGAAGDPQNHGQNINSLLGKMLRIDVNSGNPYAIPADNPLAKGEGRDEIWATGLRNPWRFSFDRATGDLYIADVGQNAFEEINWQPAGRGGVNYGWRPAEANHCYERNCDLSRYTGPIAEYNHQLGCSVTGGYVYRGAAFPRLQGSYLFGDYCSGRVWAVRPNGQGTWEQAQVLTSEARISSFGEDQAGELYLTDLASGTLYRVIERTGA